MDKIQSQLIKPFVQKMEKEWQALYDKVSQEKSSEAEKLCPEVKTHLQKIQQLLNEEDVLSPVTVSGQEDVHAFVRQSKMDLRAAERRWQRHLVSTERVKTRAMNHSAKFSDPQNPPKS